MGVLTQQDETTDGDIVEACRTCAVGFLRPPLRLDEHSGWSVGVLEHTAYALQHVAMAAVCEACDGDGTNNTLAAHYLHDAVRLLGGFGLRLCLGLQTAGANTAKEFTADNIRAVRLNLYLGKRFRAADLYKDAKFREAGKYDIDDTAPQDTGGSATKESDNKGGGGGSSTSGGSSSDGDIEYTEFE